MLRWYCQKRERHQIIKHTILCTIKVNSNTIELTVHTSCYCVLDLLCVKKLIHRIFLILSVFSDLYLAQEVYNTYNITLFPIYGLTRHEVRLEVGTRLLTWCLTSTRMWIRLRNETFSPDPTNNFRLQRFYRHFELL